MSQRSGNEENTEEQMIYETIIQHDAKTSIHIARISINNYNNDVDRYHKDRNEYINQHRRNINQEGNNTKLRELIVNCFNDKVHIQFFCDTKLIFKEGMYGDFIKTRLGKMYKYHKNFDVISNIGNNINTQLSDLFDKFLKYKREHHQF